jgi:DNA replication protein DnaC
MTKTTDNLETLLNDLECKTPPDRIPEKYHPALIDFLKQEREWRRQYRLQKLLSLSGIKPRQIKTFDKFDWGFNPKIPKQDILAFRGSDWISEPKNLVLIGDTGLGKSHIAKALCYDAIMEGNRAYFISVFDLVSRITRSRNPAARINFFAQKIKVLAIDELGYTYHQKKDVDLIFQIISKRSELLPTIITTNLAPKEWGSIFSGPAASAILDRLSFNGKFIAVEGRSYRLRSKIK